MSDRALIRLLVICGIAFVLSVGGMIAVYLSRPGAPPPEPYFEGPLPAFGPLTERSGEQIDSDNLAGRPMVVTFFFTRCTGFCPELIGRKHQLQQRLREKPWWGQLRLVSISVDPGHDTPEVLADYAARIGADPQHWLFLTPQSFEQVGRISRRSFRLPEPAMDPEQDHQIAHTDRMILVDADGAIWGYYPGRTSEGAEALIEQIDWLMKQEGADDAGAGAGEASGGEAAAAPGNGRATAWGMYLSALPAVNAGLNAVAIGLLVGGFAMIKRRQVRAHRNFMIGAFGVSALFLALYLLHKAWRAAEGGELHATYHGEGLLRGAYLLILLTHVVLAMAVPVLAIWLIRLGLSGRYERHRRVARWAFPIWMYVSVTGVVIYLMLYPFNPTPGP